MAGSVVFDRFRERESKVQLNFVVVAKAVSGRIGLAMIALGPDGKYVVLHSANHHELQCKTEVIENP